MNTEQTSSKGSFAHHTPSAGEITGPGSFARRHITAFARLGRHLSAAATIPQVLRAIVDAADEIVGWDAAICNLWSPEKQLLTCVLNIDLIGGRRTDIPREDEPPSPLLRQVLEGESKLILRQPPLLMRDAQYAFGDKNRPSASLIYVPIRHQSEVMGVLSIQSYRLDAYTQDDLNTLQALADHCAGALERVRNEETLRRTQASLVERLEALNQIHRAIIPARSAEEIAKTTLRHLQSLLPFSVAMVLVFANEKQGRILAASVRGRARRSRNAPLEAQASVSGLLEGEQHESASAWMGRIVRAAPPALIMAVPLLAGEQRIGTLYLGAERAGAFNTEHLETAENVAGQLSAAIWNARLLEELSASRAHLQTLSVQLVEVQEAERREIARELHDEIGQTLSGLHMLLEVAGKGLSEQHRSLLHMPQQLTNDLMKQVQRMCLNLRPQLLDEAGLIPALEGLFRRYNSQTGIEVLFIQSFLEDERLPARVEGAAYRLVQESLTNVARHAGVRKVVVRLWTNHGLLGIQVEDGGAGFNPQRVWEHPVSSGLPGMRERVTLLGGYFNIESGPGDGTRVTIELPFHQFEHRYTHRDS